MFGDLKVGDVFNTKFSRFIKVDLQERNERREDDNKYLVNAVDLLRNPGQPWHFSDGFDGCFFVKHGVSC